MSIYASKADLTTPDVAHDLDVYPILQKHWPDFEREAVTFAEQVAADAHGKRWVHPADRNFVDRKPPPVGVIHATVGQIDTTALVAVVHFSYGHYPEPATRLTASPDVEAMYDRYMLYRQGRDLLGNTANFCLNVLEGSVKGRQRSAASKHFCIHLDVLKTLGELTAEKGGSEARKAKGIGKEFTVQEQQWINEAIKAIIRRAAEVAYDHRQTLPQITLADLPPLGPSHQ